MIDRPLTWNETFFSHLNKITPQKYEVIANNLPPSIGNISSVIPKDKNSLFSPPNGISIIDNRGDSSKKLLTTLIIIAAVGATFLIAVKIRADKQKVIAEKENKKMPLQD